MKKKKILALIETSLIAQQEIKISSLESENKFGFVIGYTDKYLLYQEVADFEFDGYTAIAIDKINKIESNLFRETTTRIMKLEGEMSKFGITYDVDLTNWQTIFESIKKEKAFSIVEGIDKKGELFSIGKIGEIKQKKVELIDFDANGVYYKYPSIIKYKHIIQVRFDNRYVNVFQKHAHFEENEAAEVVKP